MSETLSLSTQQLDLQIRDCCAMIKSLVKNDKNEVSRRKELSFYLDYLSNLIRDPSYSMVLDVWGVNDIEGLTERLNRGVFVSKKEVLDALSHFDKKRGCCF